MDLETPLEIVCRLIVLSRELEAQVPGADPDDAEENSDSHDDPYDVLIDEKNEAIEEEVDGLLTDLAEDQLAEILSLAWVGNGTFDATEWDEAIAEAGDHTSADMIGQLMDMPMLSGYLDAGLAAFDMSCDGMGQID